MVPDYSISHSEIFAQGNTVAVFGSAQGTYLPTARSGQGEAGSRAEPAAKAAEAGGHTYPSLAGRSEVTKNNENYWKTPASWRAVVKDGRISVWQVYADNEPIRTIMRKHS